MRGACARVLLASAILALASCAVAEDAAPPGEWRPFEGTWSAVGTRHSLPTEGERPAVVVQARGAVSLTAGEGLSRGFQGEAIYFDDGRGEGRGRAVWTDDRGDRIFSELRGEPAQTGRRVAGTFTGGTGRYARIEGEYTLSWQYVVEADDGVVQSRSADLKGRFRLGEARR